MGVFTFERGAFSYLRRVAVEHGHRFLVPVVLGGSVLLIGSVGCGPVNGFVCEGDSDCRRGRRPAGMCEPVGYCSFPDPSCPSGQRYGEFSDALGGQCTIPGGGSTGEPITGGVTASGGGMSTSDDGGTVASGTGPGSDATSLETSSATTGSASVTGASASDASSSGGVDGPDLVLWLDFDGDTADRSEYDHSVSCAGSCPASTGGMFGDAVVFNGAPLEVAADTNLDFSTPFTLVGWTRVDAMNDQTRSTVFAQVYGPGQSSFDVSVQDLDGDTAYELVVDVEGAGSGLLDRIPEGQWVHLAIRIDDGLRQVFVNGQSAFDGAGAIPTSQQAPIYLGGTPGIGFPLLGAVDDVRLYRRVLNDDELEQIFRGAPVD